MLRISIEGSAGSGKSAVATLIEELLVEHGFMVQADINAPRTKNQASAVAFKVSEKDPRLILTEVQYARSEMTRG